MAVATVVRDVEGGILPLAQERVARLYTIIYIAPRARVGLGMEAAVGLGEVVVELLDVGLGEAQCLGTEDVDGLLHVGEEVVYHLLGVSRAVLGLVVVLLGAELIGCH